MNYVLKRLLMIIPMLMGISFLTYLTICLAPGGPAAGIMQDFNPKVSSEYKQKQLEHFHFDKPYHVQYFLWVKRIVKLDFGESYKDNQPVLKKIASRLPKTLLLASLSLILTFLLAVPLGIFSALKQNSFWDRAITAFVFIGFSVPVYWVALLLMIGFGIHLGWVPVTGFRSIMADEMTRFEQILDIARHLALPLIVTSLTSLAGLSRYMRNGMLEVIQQDYIRTARAKGLPENKIIFKHALRNTLLPVITILGLSLPDLISSSVIFETIFSYPGLGRLTYEAAMSRDTFLIMPTVALGAFLTLLGNLLADVCYALADPRIRVR
ncbi:MAG: Dipeptide transport system permease protein DppB [Elusimicrobia bacterium]|nr:Dipeptide transport system permease protein DppB [Elusimicrobiota bacterium]